ncbi:MAG TPA: 6-phosphogluconolactonase, partial [Caldimonas sp.]|nr:6-phosphogluconolactonase [Caldimonas sp.]
AAYELLRHADADWASWHVFFGDERCEPPDDPQRNSRMARTAWLAHVATPAGQVHEIEGERGAEEAARRAAATLSGVPDFDLVLLGLGEDGHTASLFPGHDAGTSGDAPDALAVFNAPKPPPERVSLSAHRLGRAREVVFLVAGEEKREAVGRWRRGDDIPARAIAPPAGVDVLIEARLLSPA